jgi:hypothetical protein
MKKINSMKFVKWFILACLAIVIYCAVSLDIDYVAGWAGLLGLIVACLPTKDTNSTDAYLDAEVQNEAHVDDVDFEG